MIVLYIAFIVRMVHIVYSLKLQTLRPKVDEQTDRQVICLTIIHRLC